MGSPPDWFDVLRRDVSRLADDRPLPERRGRKPPANPGASAAAVGWRYVDRPLLGAFAYDADQFDLALRRAALATYQRWPVTVFAERDIRIPRRLGLQLEAAEPGSLDVLLAVPAWIVAALASQPATAFANLLALISFREAVRVQLRRLVLTDAELRALETAPHPSAELPPPDDRDRDEIADLVESRTRKDRGGPTRQDPFAGTLSDTLHRAEPVVEVEIGHIRVRSPRPEIDVVVRSGSEVTSVSIREPKR